MVIMCLSIPRPAFADWSTTAPVHRAEKRSAEFILSVARNGARSRCGSTPVSKMNREEGQRSLGRLARVFSTWPFGFHAGISRSARKRSNRSKKEVGVDWKAEKPRTRLSVMSFTHSSVRPRSPSVCHHETSWFTSRSASPCFTASAFQPCSALVIRGSRGKVPPAGGPCPSTPK